MKKKALNNLLMVIAIIVLFYLGLLIKAYI